MLISNFPEVRGREPRIETAYSELAEQLAFGVMLASKPPQTLTPGLRAMTIARDDPLQGTWNVIVISAHFASMLAGRACDRVRAGGDQEFDFVVTYDREAIVECSQALMLRIAGSRGHGHD